MFLISYCQRTYRTQIFLCMQSTPRALTAVGFCWLFVILKLHQASTAIFGSTYLAVLFVILKLHQATTEDKRTAAMSLLFVILKLHQATTFTLNS